MLSIKKGVRSPRYTVKTTLPHIVVAEIITTWDFLVPLHTDWSSEEFANAIESYSSHPRARLYAEVVRGNELALRVFCNHPLIREQLEAEKCGA